MSTERITLIDNGEVVVTEQDAANVFNTFFSNIVTNLKIPEYFLKYADYDPIVNNISDPILKVIVRYRLFFNSIHERINSLILLEFFDINLEVLTVSGY